MVCIVKFYLQLQINPDPAPPGVLPSNYRVRRASNAEHSALHIQTGNCDYTTHLTPLEIPTTDPIYPYLFAETLNYVSYCIGYTYKSSIVLEEFATRVPTSTKSYLPLANQLVSLVVDFFARGSGDMRTKSFEDAAKVLGAAMMTKYSYYQSPLWINSVNAFISVTKLGLPDLNRSGLPLTQLSVCKQMCVIKVYVNMCM